MSRDVAQRLRRLLFIVPYVAKHPEGVPVEQLAKMLGAERDELVADLDLLSQVGPPDGDPGEYLLVSVEEGCVFVDLAHLKHPKTRADVPTYTLIPAFVISELKTAFQIGFLIFLPFLVIDLVVSSTLMSMGMVMLPPVFISLPFKILLFVLVDGWNLVTRSLVESFH